MCSIGRFISEDPIGFDGGVNWFAYANGNPVSFSDPLGLKIWVCSRLTKGAEKYFGANHSYFYDDRNRQTCGLSGPRIGFFPFFGSTAQEKGPQEGATCRPVDGSDDPGKADQLINCCKGYKEVSYIPGVSDCHNLTHSCITSANLKDPGAPGGRFGERCVKCPTRTAPKTDWGNTPKCWGGARGC